MNDLNQANFITYRSFQSDSELNEFVTIFEKFEIPFHLEYNTPNFDPSYANKQQSIDVRIKKRKSDFKLADEAQINSVSAMSL
jgi:hypothetical protein